MSKDSINLPILFVSTGARVKSALFSKLIILKYLNFTYLSNLIISLYYLKYE